MKSGSHRSFRFLRMPALDAMPNDSAPSRYSRLNSYPYSKFPRGVCLWVSSLDSDST